MKSCALFALLVLMVCAEFVRAEPATTQLSEPEVQSFELTAVAPPVPALKYSFQYRVQDQIHGNAAPIYLDAVLLMMPTAQDKAEAAWDAYRAKDFKKFESLAEELDMPATFQQVEQAGRRSMCDYNPTLEEGVMCLLPHLNFLAHGLEKSLVVNALWKIRQGKVDDALVALRRGYVLADNINEPVLVSALVSAGGRRWMNDVLTELMSNEKSPNLYWAIRELPSKASTLRRAMDCEASWVAFQSDGLKRYAAGDNLSAEEWRKVLTRDLEVAFTTMEKSYDFKSMKTIPHPDPIKDASPDALKQARAYYAESHKVSADQAAAVDPAIVLGEFYFHQFRLADDQVGKLRVLSYPEWLARIPQVDSETTSMRKNNPTNPLLVFVATLHKAVWTFARTDRQTTALAAVEAIRSYAAANNGALPKSLDAVKETPVPENPATGKPFEYRVENDVATLSDTQSESPLTYTIKIRK